MDSSTVLVFSQYGIGHAAEELRLELSRKFLGLLVAAETMPGKILFYTEGVKLTCKGSPLLQTLRSMQEAGVELVICKTCLDYFQLTDQVEVGIIGGMPDIIEAMQRAGKVISL